MHNNLFKLLFSLQRIQKRAERFNLPPNADSKKAARAARFACLREITLNVIKRGSKNAENFF